MKRYAVRDSQIVLVLSKKEAMSLYKGITGTYFQNTKLKQSTVLKLTAALLEAPK